VADRQPGERGEDAEGATADQCGYDAFAQADEPRRRHGEDAQLPQVSEGQAERNGSSGDGSDGSGSRASPR